LPLRPSDFPPDLEGKIVTPGDRRYGALRSTYAAVAGPAAVVLPESTAQVVSALRFGREQDLPLAVRSGGHGLSGRASNNGGVVIDLSAMNRVEVIDRAARVVRAQAGARWGEVARVLAPYGLAISSGDHANVGVGGLGTEGGIGWLARRDGLTIDRVRAADVVLADGTVVHADAEHEPDLLWAVRGAGAGVGIVVALEIEASELRHIGYVRIAVRVGRDGRALRQWADHMGSAPRELTTAVALRPYGAAPAASITAVVATRSTRLVEAAVEPLLKIGTGLLGRHAQLAPYEALLPAGHLHPNTGQVPGTTTNGLLATLTDDDAAAIVAAATGPRRPLVQLRSVGGAINDIPPDATAYAHRHQSTLVIASTFPPQRPQDLDAAWRPIAGSVDGAYTGFESRPGPAAFARTYPGRTGERVVRLWDRYDPDRIFRPS
jgi:hypothetical protein